MKDIPLLLVHGYPFDHTLWFSTIASLGSKAKVIAPDLPGFGKCDLLAKETPSIDAYATFLAQYLDDLKVPKVAIAGMSMGGYVALAFAEKFPGRTSGLGLISTQAAADKPEARQARLETIEKIRQHGISAVTDSILPKLFSDRKSSDPDLRKYPQVGAEKAGREGLIWALQAMADRPDRSPVLAALKCPVLVVHGSEDKIIPIARARAMAELSRIALFVEAPAAGHATPLEAPDQVAAGLARLATAAREYALMNEETTISLPRTHTQ